MASKQKGSECGPTKKSSSISQEMAAFVDRLSQPKLRQSSYRGQGKVDTTQLSTKSTEGMEMVFPRSGIQSTPKSSTESVSKVGISKSQLELRSKGSATNKGQLEVPKPSSSRTNLSRDLAASVERLSRPKSRRKAMHQNRLSLNLDEQWKSLEEAYQPNLQQALSPNEHDASNISSSRDSICSVSTNASFGSRSSLMGSYGYTQGSKLSGTDRAVQFRGRGREAESNFSRRKARSERLLASMDSLNFSMNEKGPGGSESSSPNGPANMAISKRHTLSVERLPSVGSRLMTPTLSSNLKKRVASETRLNGAQRSNPLSLKGAKEGHKYPRSSNQRLNVKSKTDSGGFGTKMRSLAGVFLRFLGSVYVH